jgi:tetratricopeptide (TPR) repeat protein
MPNDRKKPAALPIQQPSNRHPEPSKMPATDIEQVLEAALEAGDDTRALEALDAAPLWMKRQPEFMLIRATVLLSLGNVQEALQILQEIERKNPRLMGVYLPLSMLYMDQEWPAHALQAAKRASFDRDLTDVSRTSLKQLIEEATALIQALAARFGLPFETMQKACYFDEQAQMALDENKLSDADTFSKEAIKNAPDWILPHNNRAQALYFLGKTTEAIAVLETVLAREAENTFAMSSLVTYHIGLNQPEQAWNYANRLAMLSPKFSIDSIEIEHVITALALVEDTPTLWKIANRFFKAPSETLIGRSWQCLAVAAIRSGKWKDALSLIQKINKEELPPSAKTILDELEKVTNRRLPRLAWMPPAYPGTDLFLHPNIVAEWEALLQNFSDPLSPSQKHKLDRFFQKYPFMIVALKRLLWEENGHLLALQTLCRMDIPEANDEILHFALSQTGSRETRLHAMMMLIQTESYTGTNVVKIWHEDLGEWRDIELNNQQIGEIKPNVRPETMEIIEKAQNTKNPQEAITLLQKAIKMEPTCPIAVFNLGVVLTQSGKPEEGEALILRSVKVDPNYTYGHATIALTNAEAGRKQEALDHLEFVTRADIIAPSTAVIANMAWLILAIQKHDLKSARQRLEVAAQIDPKHRLLGRYRKILKEAEDFDEKFSFLTEFQRKSVQRDHHKLLKTPLTAEMDLRTCLETNTKEMLVSSAHFLQTSASGKKGELAFWLAEVLLDIEFLQQTLDEDLKEKEREALQWMLETNGVRPWKEFVHKYGDDMDESTAWNYQKPESLPGRLRMSGLFYSGILDGQQVAFIPADARAVLLRLLK